MAQAIQAEALRIGFSACGFATATEVPAEVWNHWYQWITEGKHSCMAYMGQHGEVRRHPEALLPEAHTVICVALNYYPARQQPPHHPRFAYYAYGRDYHEVMREMLQQLASFVKELGGGECRVCCDTAPIFERYWATQAGLGFIGRNSQLIHPEKGSYFFLGELLTTLSLPPSQPLTASCGDCAKCLTACPTHAICNDGTIDARRCLSCQTIENRGEIPAELVGKLGYRVYGCDTCQLVCPYNKYATPTTVEALRPNDRLLALSYEQLREMTVEEYRETFRHSAVKRVKYEGLMRNVQALDPHLFDK